MITSRLATIIILVSITYSSVMANGFRFDTIPDDTRESTLNLTYGTNTGAFEGVDSDFSFYGLRYRWGTFTSPRNETAYELSGVYHYSGLQNLTFTGTIGYRHYFLMRGSTAMSYDLGIGVSHMTRHLPGQATKNNFTEYAGITFQYSVTEDSALSLSYRFNHTSNAGLISPNRGINVNEVNAGYMWLY